MVLKSALVFMSLLWSTALWAQSWVQIEAHPSDSQARARADAYATRIDGVNVFRTRAGWYAVVIGPFSPNQAVDTLRRYRSIRAIPSDSFVEEERRFRSFVYAANSLPNLSEPSVEPVAELEPGEETQAEARASERTLTRDQRALLQIAMKWDGYYNSTIDASFGAGTRRAMSAWQEANGFEPTGILTTLQRRELIGAYQSALSSLNMTPITDPQAGIDIAIPQALVRFEKYEAPFAHFSPKTDEGVRVYLISQQGDRDTLAALFDVMQTLEIMPLDGARTLRRNEFTLTGRNEKIHSHSYVRSEGDAIKGYMLVWPAGDEKRFNLALSTMQESFTTSDGVLPDNAGEGAQDIDLLSGLEVRRPTLTRSGFFADSSGAVITTETAVRQCTRITIDGDGEADVLASDSELGIALLKPRGDLAPLNIAEFADTNPRLSSEIAVAGYSFGGILGSPSVTFGTLADVKGVNGDTRLHRLELVREDGDNGGPILDSFGAVQGLLLDDPESGRKLPGEVAFAANANSLGAFLQANGITSESAFAGETMEPEDLSLLAAEMTVLVSCWN